MRGEEMKTWMRWMAAAVLLMSAVAGCGDAPQLTEPAGPSFTEEEECDGIEASCVEDGYFGSGHTKPPPDTMGAGSGPAAGG
jgi:hypothetical protein